MALRVLLADESPTIKKVMQISLQDFGIELKAVQLGIDVVQVAEQFAPDIIFCDVLLQKKSGYDVAQELKANAKTSHIPVVLMWSGFMELDEDRFRECGAEGHIEKPFDSHALRDLVKKHVSETKEQAMSDFLEFPEVTSVGHPAPSAPTPELESEPPPEPLEIEPAYEMHRANTTETSREWNMDSFEEITHFSHQDSELDSFTQKPLQAIQSEPEPVPQRVQKPAPKPITPPIAPLSNDFAKSVKIESSRGPQGLSVADLPEEPEGLELDQEYETVRRPQEPEGLELPDDEEDISHSELLANVSMHPSDLDKFNIKPPKKIAEARPDTQTQTAAAFRPEMPSGQLTQEQLEFIIRSQSKEIIEKVVWKLVPELADKLIKEEIHRLMDETKL